MREGVTARLPDALENLLEFRHGREADAPAAVLKLRDVRRKAEGGWRVHAGCEEVVEVHDLKADVPQAGGCPFVNPLTLPDTRAKCPAAPIPMRSELKRTSAVLPATSTLRRAPG